ncbi:MAG: hypothetical protein A3J93_03790 [Candidatus Magasanikbacteria bacterium RIFOXYC2_FULL_42_28]|uniref:Glycosyl transferase family 1 domain-containing protein n=1 Tax=Candidatus Magasanikbacteria bacterium RIFOXYC2_FULL_42_28 TaxID=1798704 RepID=A0A1F6NUS0_9BACT|nr:MAG: hypothetical protein A3J93_03790 [Candidatus Magasanikbacteria bacterium RIFOXYC2_FULL_42_28]
MVIGIEASHAVKLPRTGVEEACWQMIENLKSTLPADTRVILYSHILPTDQLKDLPPNWKWKILNWPLKKLWSQLRLSYELFKNPPDIFFALGQLLPFFLPKKIKVVTFVHDSAFEAEPEVYSFLGKIYLKLMNRRITRRSDKIITSTEFNKQELQKYYGVASEKTIVVPLAYDKNVFCIGSVVTLSVISKPYFIFLGRLEEKKNTPLLVRAFNQVRHDGVDCQLLLIGKPGHGFEQVQFGIENSPYQNDIIRPGYVDTKDLPGIIRGARALILPSRYEGFGMPILEGMACGTPVIASDILALREVGGDAVAYIRPTVPDLATIMATAVKDSIWRQNHIQAGLEQVKNFSWVKTSAKIGQVIANI